MSTKCSRTNCFAFREDVANGCNALISTYKDDMECPFFKTAKELDEQRKRLNVTDNKK